MVRKLALAVSLALGTVSVPVHALGLGELSSKSGLNQNFSGDITLLSVQAEELDSVRVKLADPDAFERAGVERPFYLSLLKFEPTLTAKGATVIRVTSEFPIREPFLNFLLEVNWPNGRLLREYTVLLDPPTTTMRRPPQVAPAAQRRSAAPVPAAAPPRPAAAPAKTTGQVQPVAAGGGTEYGPVKSNDTAWSIAKQLRPRGVSMEQMMIALLNANPNAFVDGNINRLRKGQILRVPSAAEIQELSRAQARQAYREQQDAWLAQRNEKLQRAAEQTAADVTPAGADAAATDAQDQLRIATARPEGEGEAGAGDDNATATTSSSDLSARLIAARENAETSRQEAETLRSQVDDLQERLQNMQKLLTLKDDQLAQLQDRVVSEEAEVPAAQAPAEADAAEVALANQVDLQAADVTAAEVAQAVDQAVAEMTRAADAPAGEYRIQEIPPQIDADRIVMGGKAETPSALGIPPQVDPDRIVMGGSAGAPVAEQMVPEVEPAPTVEVSPAVATDTAVDAAQASSGSNVVVIEGATETGQAGVPVTAVPAEPAVAADQPAAVEPSVESTAPAAVPGGIFNLPKPLANMIEQNIVPIAAGGITLLALIGWLATRGRRRPASGPGAAQAALASSDQELPAVDQPALDAAALDELPDSSFLDEFSPSDIDALHDETGEVDPVSEADVYIAYGRYQQAEDLLRQAMERDPDRLALKHKLLEVHYATRNAETFSALAQEMVDAGQDSVDEDAWARALDMGRELSPDNPLFAQASGRRGAKLAGLAAAAAAGAAAKAVDDDTLSLDDLELSELTAAYDEDNTGSDDLEAPSEVSILLDLDEASSLSESTMPEMPASISLDELDSLDFALPEADKADTARSEPVEEDSVSDSFNLDSMMAQAEAAVDSDESTLSLDSEFSADELQAQLDELSDLSVLDSDLDEQPETTPSAVAPGGSMGLVYEDTSGATEGLDQPISLDESVDADEAEEVGAEILDFGSAVDADDAGGEDDITTKLDLARAYVEMGDQDGARSILEEVLGEGNDEQKGNAEKLLSQLG